MAGFINYQLEASYQQTTGYDNLNIPWEAGFNIGSWFAFNSFNYRHRNKNGWDYQRMQSRLIWDDPIRMNRLILGDFSAPSGVLAGGGGQFGGITWQRQFGLNRKFQYTPELDLQTVIETPVHASLYVNNVLIEEWELLPGEVSFPEISKYAGQGNIELRLTDAFGRERRLREIFYTSQNMLKPGLHEYSYSFGFRRENMGRKSNAYGKPAFLGFHNYGFHRTFTAGIAFEIDQKVTNLGATMNTSLGYNQLETALAVSREDKQIGYGMTARYNFKYRRFNAVMGWNTFSKHYASLNLRASEINKPRYQGNINLSYSMETLGSINLAYSESRTYNKQQNQRISFSYNQSFDSNIVVSLGMAHNMRNKNDIFLRLIYYPVKRQGFFDNLNYQRRQKTADTQDEISLQKDSPRALGSGYNARVTRTNGKQIGTGQYRYKNETGNYRAAYSYKEDTPDSGQLSYAGSLAWVGDEFYYGRPIYDSFALVQAQGLENVEVRSGGTQMGTTGKDGKLLVSDLNSYQENQISISMQDLPLNYKVDQFHQNVRLGQRGGSVVNFKITQFIAVEGYLYLQAPNGQHELLDLRPLEITIRGNKQESFTAEDGYFYLENTPVGTHNIHLPYGKNGCVVKLEVPKTEKVVINLGKLVCIPN